MSRDRTEMLQALEAWYVWMNSKHNPSFSAEDRKRLMEPLARFKTASDWIEWSSLAKSEWFFQIGSEMYQRRISGEEWDIYE